MDVKSAAFWDDGRIVESDQETIFKRLRDMVMILKVNPVRFVINFSYGEMRDEVSFSYFV